MKNSMPKTVAVCFSDVSVREFELLPCDNNPSVQCGPGIELGWRYNVLHNHKPIDEYEEERCKKRIPKYHLKEPPSRRLRHIKLKRFGFTEKEINDAERSCARRRRELEKSVARMRRDRIYELKEDMSIALKRLRMVR
mmetsp:Transcript_40704/g.85513  ORF Transcript_40704/g.85513 Transcript_40704/m.85513 type:complete len:138 (+) Transcript_40704:55-468(+)